MTTNKKDGTFDWSNIFALMAFALFTGAAFIVIGGWVFSIVWNAFMVPVFALPPIDIGEGFAALTILYLSGHAVGFRKSAVTKTVEK